MVHAPAISLHSFPMRIPKIKKGVIIGVVVAALAATLSLILFFTGVFDSAQKKYDKADAAYKAALKDCKPFFEKKKDADDLIKILEGDDFTELVKYSGNVLKDNPYEEQIKFVELLLLLGKRQFHKAVLEKIKFDENHKDPSYKELDVDFFSILISGKTYLLNFNEIVFIVIGNFLSPKFPGKNVELSFFEFNNNNLKNTEKLDKAATFFKTITDIEIKKFLELSKTALISQRSNARCSSALHPDHISYLGRYSFTYSDRIRVLKNVV